MFCWVSAECKSKRVRHTNRCQCKALGADFACSEFASPQGDGPHGASASLQGCWRVCDRQWRCEAHRFDRGKNCWQRLRLWLSRAPGMVICGGTLPSVPPSSSHDEPHWCMAITAPGTGVALGGGEPLGWLFKRTAGVSVATLLGPLDYLKQSVSGQAHGHQSVPQAMCPLLVPCMGALRVAVNCVLVAPWRISGLCSVVPTQMSGHALDLLHKFLAHATQEDVAIQENHQVRLCGRQRCRRGAEAALAAHPASNQADFRFEGIERVVGLAAKRVGVRTRDMQPAKKP